MTLIDKLNPFKNDNKKSLLLDESLDKSYIDKMYDLIGYAQTDLSVKNISIGRNFIAILIENKKFKNLSKINIYKIEIIQSDLFSSKPFTRLEFISCVFIRKVLKLAQENIELMTNT
jgi:hypothetical protein